MTGAVRTFSAWTPRLLAMTVLICSCTSSFAQPLETAPETSELSAFASAVCRIGLAETAPLNARYANALTITDTGTLDTAFRRTFMLRQDNRLLTVQLTAFAGQLRRLRSYSEALQKDKKRPLLLIDYTPDCQIQQGRRIAYNTEGQALHLVHLNHHLEPTGPTEPLNPPVPPGDNVAGISVAQIDSGVNYQLETVAKRLARDMEGKLLGYDFWDNDPQPYDADTSRSPFFPLHHGTAVASILLREAPAVQLMPFRYPRPDMSRMTALIEQAAAQGARIVMMPLGSTTRSEWQAFHAAATRHPEMLFIISAGNDGRDIDQVPLYPGVFELVNMLVVTSSDDFGRLATGSNWGVTSVDVMVPGEKVEVTDHRGAKGEASGSSFAVPRIAALAARLLAAHPDWTTTDLMTAIRNRAVRSRERGLERVKWGWIPNPAEDS